MSCATNPNAPHNHPTLPGIPRHTFTGSVHHDRGEDWLRALERAYPLRVQYTENNAIELVPTGRTLAGSSPISP